MYQIIHYRKKCIGCDACVVEAPDTWHISEEDGKSLLKNAKEKDGVYVLKCTDDGYYDNKRAEESCPVNIISVKVL